MVGGLSEVSEAYGEAEFVLLLVPGVAGRVDEDELRAFGSLGNVLMCCLGRCSPTSRVRG